MGSECFLPNEMKNWAQTSQTLCGIGARIWMFGKMSTHFVFFLASAFPNSRLVYFREGGEQNEIISKQIKTVDTLVGVEPVSYVGRTDGVSHYTTESPHEMNFGFPFPAIFQSTDEYESFPFCLSPRWLVLRSSVLTKWKKNYLKFNKQRTFYWNQNRFRQNNIFFIFCCFGNMKSFIKKFFVCAKRTNIIP